jgi:hypothetical protein
MTGKNILLQNAEGFMNILMILQLVEKIYVLKNYEDLTSEEKELVNLLDEIGLLKHSLEIVEANPLSVAALVAASQEANLQKVQRISSLLAKMSQIAKNFASSVP